MPSTGTGMNKNPRNMNARNTEKSKKQLAESGRFEQPIVTKIEPAQPFYLAEEDHQEYYKKHPENFKRNHARRAAFIEENWRNEG